MLANVDGFSKIEAEGLKRILKDSGDVSVWRKEGPREMLREVLENGIEPMTDNQEKLIYGISSLSDMQKQCYYMRTFEELTYSEIGIRIGATGSAARTHILIAQRKLLAAKLGPLPSMQDKRMQQAVSRLGGKVQKYFLMHHDRGMTHTQIMRETGDTIGTISNALTMAKARVYIYLDELTKAS